MALPSCPEACSQQGHSSIRPLARVVRLSRNPSRRGYPSMYSSSLVKEGERPDSTAFDARRFVLLSNGRSAFIATGVALPAPESASADPTLEGWPDTGFDVTAIYRYPYMYP